MPRLASTATSNAPAGAFVRSVVEVRREQLQKLDSIKKVVDGIEKGAAKIDRECEAMNAVIRRRLGQALAALAGSAAVSHDVDTAGMHNGAACQRSARDRRPASSIQPARR